MTGIEDKKNGIRAVVEKMENKEHAFEYCITLLEYIEAGMIYPWSPIFKDGNPLRNNYLAMKFELLEGE